jgi:type I restriction enzyme M protein
MLDSTTKKRIDDCRDILVGKLPDPKSQIEQITIALIYKFMDDMDKEAVELGGKAKFFSGNYAKFAWDELFDAQLGSADMLALYAEAIESMEKNGNIPQLFRDIFKNAYLPYRDPATLKMFLKTIGEFSYGHSEMLGDAFEYLLSIMGSQGDAGQFRTPRHIIDFLVEVVNPTLNDTILDPACGTAGFLISAYKHILKQNKGKLTPDQRKKLMSNVVGYDISPDMQRLALVNLYLHGFNDPHIYEYDTLSSEERWDETFDVVLANPPFMTPKGGIRPHKRFGVQSNRSEVLFVDYIAEHLNTKGRAGIIVPEGVIFQSGKAYKDLRKMLVEDHLYAVVSLPSGVFNPYSNVKTSVLVMDRQLSKNNKDILFVNVANDGYNLGSQRTEIKGGQLSDAAETLSDFRLGKFVESEIAHLVPKVQIAANGDYNLSGQRYKVQVAMSTEYSTVPLGDLAVTFRNGINVKQQDEEGEFRVSRIQTISDGTVNLNKTKWTNDEVSESYFIEEGDILISHINSFEHIAKSALFTGINDRVVHGINLVCFKPDRTKVIPEYVSSIIKSSQFVLTVQSYTQKAVNQASVRLSDLKSIHIPLPPLSIQEEIVTEIVGYQKIIDGARMVVENYRPQISIDPDWEMVELGEVCKLRGGYAFKSSDYVEEGAELIRMGNVRRQRFYPENYPKYLPISYVKEYENYVLRQGDIIISMTGTVGKQDYGAVCMIDRDGNYLLNQRVGKFEITDKRLSNAFLYFCADQEWFRQMLFANASGGVRQENISNKGIEAVRIPLPHPDIQQKITEQLEEEMKIISSNERLIATFETKIKERIDRVWGK